MCWGWADLSPLSYIAGTLIGNPHIHAYTGASYDSSSICSSAKALESAGIKALPLQPKEHLGILNGTAFSAGLAALVLNDATHLTLLAQLCTALGTEALLGTSDSHSAFIHNVCRPHPGQVEVASVIGGVLEGSKLAKREDEEGVEKSIEEDEGELRQDRYPLRTSPQWLGPQVEDVLSAWESVTLECNSSESSRLIRP